VTWIPTRRSEFHPPRRGNVLESKTDRDRDVDPLADRELLAGVRERRPEALERFFDAAFPFVFSVAMRLARDRNDAEDVTQDALHRIHRTADRLDPDRSSRPWLAVITANVFRDRLRRLGRRRETGAEPATLARVAVTRERPEERLERREEAERLERAIGALDEKLRSVLVLRAQSDCSYEEIAEALGIRPAAARKRYSRAIARVRELVGRDGS
jgi:RNA polymerase sigma-70 factor (ECF subfamily)